MHSGQLKMFQKLCFVLLARSTEKIEFDHVKFRESISSEDVV